MVYVNEFSHLADSDAFEQPIAAKDKDGIVIVSPRKS